MSVKLECELAALRSLSRQQLQGWWRDLYKAAPPTSFTPDLIARGIAWKLQEKALGGLSAEAKRLLGIGSSREGASLRKRSTSRASLRPGNRLVRRWRGRTYVVEVDEQGLVYDGERYGSLSIIAGKITGTRWSGPSFFGLVK